MESKTPQATAAALPAPYAGAQPFVFLSHQHEALARIGGQHEKPAREEATTPGPLPATTAPSRPASPSVRVVSPDALWPYLHRGKPFTVTWQAAAPEGASLRELIVELYRDGERV